MGHKIFVSYKYWDYSVNNLNPFTNSKVRDYVDKLEGLLDSTDHIYKGESDDEDLSDYSDDYIWETLKDRIYDSTLTIIFISPKMKEEGKRDRSQWIPWEVSYSLKATNRKNANGDSITSNTNAMIAVVLPDENNSYSYYLEQKNCCLSPCTTHHTDKLFKIIRENKFNLIEATKKHCDTSKSTIWYGDHSYIEAVRWDSFTSFIDYYIERAYKRQENLDNYEIHKDL